MRLEHTLSIKQTHGLSLTPQMQQSLKLLQMSTAEITAFVAEQLLNNPFLLEQEKERDQDYQEPAYDHDPDLAVLQGQDYSNFWTDVPPSRNTEGDRQEWLENVAPIRLSLRHHLMVQLHLATQDKQIRFIGEVLIDHLEEDGYLRTDLTCLGEELKISQSEILTVLKLIQTFEPVGVGARTLTECFQIQLKDLGLLSPSMVLILENLEVVLSRGWEGLSKESGLTRKEVEEAIYILRTLNPKPGLTFDPDPIEILIPDLYLRYQGQGDVWVELNEEAQPRVLANQGYYQELNKRVRRKEEKEYIATHYQQATWLEKALKQRAETMLKVANAIVVSQKNYLLGKAPFLKPMTLRDLAQELGLHESTISRATTHKFIVTPLGTRELKEFFTHSVRADEDLSAHHVQQRIRALINEEPPVKPLSDDQLVLLLCKEGIEVARRTVTKYREGMNIPSSYERKRQARLMTF